MLVKNIKYSFVWRVKGKYSIFYEKERKEAKRFRLPKFVPDYFSVFFEKNQNDTYLLDVTYEIANID